MFWNIKVCLTAAAREELRNLILHEKRSTKNLRDCLTIIKLGIAVYQSIYLFNWLETPIIKILFY